MSKKNSNKVQRQKRTVITLLVVWVLLLLTGFYGLNRLYPAGSSVGIVKRSSVPLLDSIFPTPDPFLLADDSNVDYYETGELQRVPIYEQKQIDKFIMSFLVVIQNGDLRNETDLQTDMIFLVSFNQRKQQLTVVNILRDMAVPMENVGWKRINAAYTRGGIGMLMNTLNDTFGLDLQYYAYTGTEELKDLCDLVGGVPMKLTAAEAAYINEALGKEVCKEGVNQLTGEAALAHLMDRTSDGTGVYGRARRQTNMITNMFNYLRKNHDRKEMMGFLTSILVNVRTNTDMDMIKTFGYGLVMSDDLTMQMVQLPFEDSYYETALDNAYCIVPELEKNRILLSQALFGKE